MVATITPRQRLFRVAPAALVAIGFGVAVLFGAMAVTQRVTAQEAENDDQAAAHAHDPTHI